MKLKLRNKIVLITVAILFLFMSVNTLVNGMFFSREYSQALEMKAFVISQTLKAQLDRLLNLRIPLENLVGFDEQCRDVVTQYEEIVHAIVTDMNGTILFHSDSSKHGERLSDALLTEIVENLGQPVHHHKVKGKSVSCIAVPVMGIRDELLGTLILGYETEYITRKTRMIIFSSIEVFFVISGISIILLIVLLNAWVTRPLHELMAVISEIQEKGGMSAKPIFFDSDDEIGHLAAAFNKMMDELNASHEKVRQYALDLENKVRERTLELVLVNEQLEKDIEKRKHTETELRESEERFRAVFSGAEDCIFLKNRSLRYTHVNPAVERLLNIPALKFIGKTDREVFGKEDAPHIREMDCQVLDGHIVRDERSFNAAGRMVVFHVIKAPLYNESDDVVGLCGIARNVTERKNAEENLRKANRELKNTQQQLIQSAKLASIGELSAGIAHELNQPLMVIRTNAQLISRYLKKGTLVPEALNRHSMMIERNTKRMMNIIGHLRIFSRQSETEMSPVDINAVMEDAFMMISEQLRIHNIEVEKGLSLRLPKISANANQLEQVLLNMITNARDAVMENTGKKGKITIVTGMAEADKDAVEILVGDNGCGIDPENRAKIFDPFFTTKEVGKGTGLGLSISYGIIRNHKGAIEVKESGAAGTVFGITLPVSASECLNHE